MLAKDFMTRSVGTVAGNAPVEEIAKIRLRHNISLMPVVEGDAGAVPGLVSAADLMRRADPGPELWLRDLTRRPAMVQTGNSRQGNKMTEFCNTDRSPTPFVRRPFVSQWLLERALGAFIHRGTLHLRLPDGNVRSFGQGTPEIAIALHDWRTLRRIALNADLAVGEAWMDGTLTVERGDIYGFLDLCLANAGTGAGYGLRRMQQRLRRMIRPLLMHNPIGTARKNVAHHYDLSDELYDLFLDAKRQYSCAYYATPEDSLEEAQARKMRHIAAKLRLAPGQKLLDIGSGWGGLGLYLARMAGVDVTGVTLSVEQQRYAETLAARKGLAGRARFVLRDYREESGRYDRIVSVGMFEHVGAGHYDEYFTKLAALLKEDGVAMVHTIGSLTAPGAPHPWIRKYIFPGGYIPSLSEITPAIERSGLVVTDIEVLRLHYAETLKAWRERFMAHRDEVAALYDERFCRMWEFYLAACEAGFRHNGLVVFQFQLTHRLGTLPLTRDYLAKAETALEKTPPELAPVGARRKPAKQLKELVDSDALR